LPNNHYRLAVVDINVAFVITSLKGRPSVANGANIKALARHGTFPRNRLGPFLHTTTTTIPKRKWERAVASEKRGELERSIFISWSKREKLRTSRSERNEILNSPCFFKFILQFTIKHATKAQ